MRYLLIAILSFIMGVVLSGIGRVDKPVVTTDTITLIDTIREPVYEESSVVRYITRRLKVTDTLRLHDSVQIGFRDSVYVDVPIVQKTYQGTDYKAWVSGYEPSLDSISIAHKIITNTITIKDKKRWGLGIQMGVGYNGKIAPYVGVGLQYNLIKF